MTELIYEDKWATIYHGDTREVASDILTSKSIDMIMTSVPYWRQRYYGESAMGFEKSIGEWLRSMEMCWRGWERLLKPTGSLFLNVGDKWGGQGTGSSYGDKRNTPAPEDYNDSETGKALRMKPAETDRVNRKGNLMQLPERLTIQMQDSQLWTLVNKVIWHKPDISVQSYQRKFVPTYEPIFFMAKDEQRYKFYRDRIGVTQRGTQVELLAEARKEQMAIVPAGTQTGFFGDVEENRGLDPDNPPDFNSPYYEFWYNNTRPKQAWHDHKADAVEGQRFTRGKVLRHPSGSNPGDLWSITTPTDAYFKQNALRQGTWPSWPRELCVLPILATTDEGDTIYDPFGGSGTLGVVAKSLGRKVILVDVNIESCRIMADRIIREPEPLIGQVPMITRPPHPWDQWMIEEDE